MVIRIKKMHLLIFAVLIISVSLIFTLKNEKIEKFTSSQSELTLPIVMYHHVTEKDSRAGKYVIKLSELESDLEYLKKCGYTCVTVDDLIDYINGRKALPEKIVMITFDDGFESIYSLVWQALKTNGMKAVASPVGAVTEEYTKNGDKNINYAYMTWDELSELDKSEEFEIQNHTYNMHNSGNGARKGLSRMSGESEDAYRDALKDDLSKMQKMLKKKADITSTAVVYPYGLYSKATLEIIKELGFECSMVCEERINKIRQGDKDSLYNLGRFNRPSGIKTESFFERLGIS